MRICILGLGYVGTVAGGCLAAAGHDIVGVDVDGTKAELFGQGRASFVEPGLDEMLAQAHAAGKLTSSNDPVGAPADADLVLVTVGTPSGVGGEVNLDALRSVADDLGTMLRSRSADKPVTIVARSTVPPGTTRNLFIPRIEEVSGREHGKGWTCVFAPEFLREGCAIDDFKHPPQTIVGAIDNDHAGRYLEALGDLGAPTHVCALETAELMKYACNCFHAVKIAFANELGAVSRAVGADGRDVMRLVCEDKILNISTAYMRPGNAFGGSCLPKDLKGLNHIALEHGIDIPMLKSVMPANDAQIERLVTAIKATGHKKIGVAGLAFKDDTDDLRDSPMVRVVREMLLHSYDVKVWDKHVVLAALRGNNLQFIRMGIPQLSELLVAEPIDLARSCETLVLFRKLDVGPALRDALADRAVIDLVGHPDLEGLPGYTSVFW